MKRLGVTVVKNAIANVVRGGASAIVAVALPHFLAHDLSTDRFSAWVLMLQIAAYSNYLDFGIQTAVARYVAQATELGDQRQRDKVISTALALLLVAGAVALLVSLLIASNIPRLFHSAPIQLLDELRGGILLLSASAAALLPLSTFSGVLIGLHSNEYPALAVGSTRLLGAAAVLGTIHFTHSLVWLASCVAVCNLLGGFLQYRFSRQLIPDMHLAIGAVSRRMTKEMVHYCAGLTAFNFGMLLVGGLDITIVGLFSFGDTGYYGVATTVIAMIVGLAASFYSALLAPLAVLQQREEYSRLQNLVLSTTRLGTYAAIALAILITVAGKPLLTLWVGPRYGARAFPLLEILLWAQALRLTGSSYSTALVATAQQNYAISAALAEGITNLLASILGAWLFGPIGVAWGTMLGSVCGILWITLRVMPRVAEVAVDARGFVREAILRPVSCFSPVLAFVTLRMRSHVPAAEGIVAATSVVVTSLLLFRFGQIPRFSISSEDRSVS